MLLNSCDHIDAVGDKVNELKDLRTESTQGIGEMKLDQIIEGVKGGPTVQEVSEAEFGRFTMETGRLNIVEFRSADSAPSEDFSPVMAAAVEANSSVARLGRIDVENALDLAKVQEVRKVPEVRFFLDGEMVHRFSGNESLENLDKLIKSHSASVIPVDDFATQLNDGLDKVSGDKEGLRPTGTKRKAKSINEAMKPMEKDWLPPGMSAK